MWNKVAHSFTLFLVRSFLCFFAFLLRPTALGALMRLAFCAEALFRAIDDLVLIAVYIFLAPGLLLPLAHGVSQLERKASVRRLFYHSG